MNGFKKLTHKIWKDSVGGNIISAGILGFLSIVYNLILSKASNTDFGSTFLSFWNLQLELWKIAILFLITITTIQLFKRHQNKKNLTFKYDPDTLELDRDLYKKITGIIITQQNVLDLRNQMFSSESFPSERINWIYNILEENKKSDFEFFNPNLETSKKNLITTISDFQRVLVRNIYSAGQVGWLGVPREWERDRFYEAANQISIAEINICHKYDDFVKESRTTLKI